MKLNLSTSITAKRIKSVLAVAAIALVSACSSSDPVDTSIAPGDYAYIATKGDGSGQIEAFSLTNSTTTNAYPADLSDIRVATDGTNVYQLGRYNIDTLTKFDVADTANTMFQFSVNGDETASNPYKVVFVSDTKAYVIRYGSNKVWIINPSATVESEFKTGELDLSAYDVTNADDGTTSVPNASDAVLVGTELYILMERLTGFNPIETGYVAVFDTTTDTEVNTGQGENGLLGVKLSTLNPAGLQYVDGLTDVFVTGRGNVYQSYNNLPGDPYQGGIEVIDTADYTLSMLLDDGDQTTNDGFFIKSLVVSPTIGYLVTNNATYQQDTLRQFNPTTGVLSANTIPTFVDTAVSDLALAPDGRLWVGVPGATAGDGSGYYQVDTAANAVVGELLPTLLSPINVVFLTVPEPTPAAE